MSFFVDDMILSMEIPIVSAKNPLKLMNEFGKRAKYIMNFQKSVAFFYSNNDRAERGLKGSIPFGIRGKNNTKVPRNQFNEKVERLAFRKV